MWLKFPVATPTGTLDCKGPARPCSFACEALAVGPGRCGAAAAWDTVVGWQADYVPPADTWPLQARDATEWRSAGARAGTAEVRYTAGVGAARKRAMAAALAGQ